MEKSCNAVKQYLNIFPHNGHLAVRPDCVPHSVGLYRQLSHKRWAVLGPESDLRLFWHNTHASG